MDTHGTHGDDTLVSAWVNRLAMALLTAMLLYVIIGIPEFDRETALATDYVSPLNRFVWLGLLALSLPVAYARRGAVLALMRASWPLLLLYAYFAASVAWALDPDASMRRLLFTVVQLALSVILLSGVRRAASLHVLIAAVCTVAAAADLLTWIAMPGFAMTDEGLAGLQLQKNQTGLLMMYGCLSGATAFFLLRGWFWRAVTAGAVLMMAGLLVATRSTTSQSIVLLAPVVVPFILVMARLPRRWAWTVAAVIPTGIVALAFGYVAWCGIANADPWLPMRGATFTGRTDLWSFVVDEIAKRPWLGAGYSSFWAIDPAIQPSLKSDMWFGVYAIINEAHEGYLDELATGGVVGLAGVLLVVFRTIAIAGRAVGRAEPAAVAWRTARMAYPTAAFHMALLVGLLVHNLTESNLFSNNSVLAVAFVLAALDLEKWRLATRRPAAKPFPHPTVRRPLMRPPPMTGATGLAAPAP